MAFYLSSFTFVVLRFFFLIGKMMQQDEDAAGADLEDNTPSKEENFENGGVGVSDVIEKLNSARKSLHATL